MEEDFVPSVLGNTRYFDAARGFTHIKAFGREKNTAHCLLQRGAYTCLSGIYASYISSVKRSLSNPPTVSGKLRLRFLTAQIVVISSVEPDR